MTRAGEGGGPAAGLVWDIGCMEIFKGIPVSPGVVIGRVFALDDERVRAPRRVVSTERSDRELERLEEALRGSIEELEELQSRASEGLGAEAAKIFAFHQGMLADTTLTEPMRERIRGERVTAEYAVAEEFRRLAEWFAGMGDTSFSTKVDDVWDLERRVMRRLIGEHMHELEALEEPRVVVARDLTPSQTAGFEGGRVVAIATDAGGRTSHTAIVAHALGIPAVLGSGNLSEKAKDGDLVVVDGDRGVVILHPDEETVEEHRRYIERMKRFSVSLDELAEQASQTSDGTRIKLYGNVEFAHEARRVVEQGGDGIGLYRSEFLWLTSDHEPSEDEQFEAYVTAVRALAGRPATIRTFDLGADKAMGSGRHPKERNPFLGLRSIRYCLQHLPMFKRQLRAILRASAEGKVRLMFPLITSAMELRQAKMVLRDVMEDLTDEEIPYDADMEVGIMVESPAAAVMASAFARECDFFSIGTNDLVQYVLAVDRTNENVANLYSPAHPAVIKLMKETIRAARRWEIDVSCCGEMAGDLEFTMLLIGLGLRSLSLPPASIPRVKRLVRSVDVQQCERLARKAGSFDSERQIASFLRDQTRKIIPEAFDGRSVEV